MKLTPLQLALRTTASPARAAEVARFFKTGIGQYGHGDTFIGVAMPTIRLLARQHHSTTSPAELSSLIHSPIHEDRSLALCLLIEQFTKAKTLEMRQLLHEFYLDHRDGINNWDLVDISAPHLLGKHSLITHDNRAIIELSQSSRHWDRRMAMVACLAPIKAGQTDLAYRLAQQFLGESEDLMHKATGWMLRECGKINAHDLLAFIHQHGMCMPRTMLRYAIEKFPAEQRQRILTQTKGARPPHA